MSADTGLRTRLDAEGFAVAANIFSLAEADRLAGVIEAAARINANFRENNALFAIRNLLGEVPALHECLWTDRFRALTGAAAGKDCFLVKAIYFNKPAQSNWLVPWHQDTTISVDRRAEIDGFGPWTMKQGLQAVQPSRAYLEDIVTCRIHLDDCDETNGALKVIPGSHNQGVLSDEVIRKYPKQEQVCAAAKGSVLLMKPLLLHASAKSTSDRPRRVIHLEFASRSLPGELQWREYCRPENRQS